MRVGWKENDMASKWSQYKGYGYLAFCHKIVMFFTPNLLKMVTLPFFGTREYALTLMILQIEIPLYFRQQHPI